MDISPATVAPIHIPWEQLAKSTWWDLETLKQMSMEGTLFEGGSAWRTNFLASAREHGTSTARHYLNSRYGKLMCETICDYSNGIYTVKSMPLRTEEGPTDNKFVAASMS
jgi:hypothetical protein